MFTIDTKKIRYDYNTLSALVNEESNEPMWVNIYQRVSKITQDKIMQVYSERHGRVINAVTKTIGNATYLIIVDEEVEKLELSPYIHIKEPNGKIVLTWNIKDEIVIFLPNNV